MSEDLPLSTPDERESRLTALLLGELSPEESAALREAIARDPALRQTLERLEKTAGWVRLAMQAQAGMPSPASELRLSPERREALLSQFRSPPPSPSLPEPRRLFASRELLQLAAMLALLFSLAALLFLPDWRFPEQRVSFVTGAPEALKNSPRLYDDLQEGEAVSEAPFRHTAKEPVDAERLSRTPQAIRGKDVANFDFSATTQPTPPGPVVINELMFHDRVEEIVNMTSNLADQVGQKQSLEAGRRFRSEEMGQPGMSGYFFDVTIDGQDRFGGGGVASRPLGGMAGEKWFGGGRGGISMEGRPGGPEIAMENSTKKEAQKERSSARDQPPATTGNTFSRSEPMPGLLPVPRKPSGSIELPGAPQSPKALGAFPAEEKAESDELKSQEKFNGIYLRSGIQQEEPVALGDRFKSKDKPASESLRAGEDAPTPSAAAPVQVLPELSTAENPFSTFSLQVRDVSFQTTAAALKNNTLPRPGEVRPEEFLNAFDYRDPQPPPGVPVGFAWERARHPLAHDRDLLRFSLQTAAVGREAGRPLNLVLLLDNSGSMERSDRVRIVRECLRLLATQLQPADRVSLVTFSRRAQLVAEGVAAADFGRLLDRVAQLTPEGGTNLEEGLGLAYATARRQAGAGSVSRVLLMTDGAANLGNVDPETLRARVESERKGGVALDCFGIGWEGYHDSLLELLSRHGDGRYAFINSPEAAGTEFVRKIAGALQVAAQDVKVQVEFNPRRTVVHRQIGYAALQLAPEQFRDNTVDAAELGAAESGTALYAVQLNPAGEGPIGVVRVRYKVPGTGQYREQAWTLPYTRQAPSLDQATPSMRLAAVAGLFGEWMGGSPHVPELSSSRLLALLQGVPEHFATDPRPRQLEWMIRTAGNLLGK